MVSKVKFLPFLILFLFGLNNVIVGYRLFDFSYDRLIQLLVFFFLLPLIFDDIKKDNHFKNILFFFMGIFLLRIFVVFIANIDGVYVDMQVAREIIRSFY